MLKPFTPVPLLVAQETTMSLWVSGDNASTIVSSAGNVSAWRDQSGFKNNGTQATGSKQPDTGSTTIAGKNVIDFTRLNSDSLSVPDSIIGSLVNDSLTVFIVGQSSVASPPALAAFFGSSTSTRFYIYQQAATGTIRTALGSTAGSGLPPLVLDSGVSASAAPFVAMVTYVGSTDTGTLNVNNSAIVTGTGGVSTPADVTIGSAGNASFVQGSVAEVIVYQGLVSASNQLSLFRYLGEKWGVTIS